MAETSPEKKEKTTEAPAGIQLFVDDSLVYCDAETGLCAIPGAEGSPREPGRKRAGSRGNDREVDRA